MSQFAKELKSYAEQGLRTEKDWLSVGRQVENGSKPRTTAAFRAEVVELFTRDQTRPADKSARFAVAT